MTLITSYAKIHKQLTKGGKSIIKKEFITQKEILRLPMYGEGESAITLRDKDTLIKLYKPNYLNIEKYYGIDNERKIRDLESITNIKEIIKPISTIYDPITKELIATRIPLVRGMNYDRYTSNYLYEEECEKRIICHERFESILKRASENNIVLPDFTTCDNIIVTNSTDNNPSISLIDIEGMQVKNNESLTISTSLLSKKEFFLLKYELVSTQKYLKSMLSGRMPLFKEELNIYSQYVLFFLDILNLDITHINTMHPNGKLITLDDVCNLVGLDDYDIQHKLWLLFQQQKKNEWLGDDKYTILDNYDIVIHKLNGHKFKRLERKR